MENSKTPGKKSAAKTMKFEEAMLRIEEIARQLEDETLDLDTALTLYEEGKKCISFCDKKITAAEPKSVYFRFFSASASRKRRFFR